MLNIWLWFSPFSTSIVVVVIHLLPTPRLSISYGTPQLKNKVVSKPECFKVWVINGFCKLHSVSLSLSQVPDLRSWNILWAKIVYFERYSLVTKLSIIYPHEVLQQLINIFLCSCSYTVHFFHSCGSIGLQPQSLLAWPIARLLPGPWTTARTNVG